MLDLRKGRYLVSGYFRPEGKTDRIIIHDRSGCNIFCVNTNSELALSLLQELYVRDSELKGCYETSNNLCMNINKVFAPSSIMDITKAILQVKNRRNQ